MHRECAPPSIADANLVNLWKELEEWLSLAGKVAFPEDAKKAEQLKLLQDEMCAHPLVFFKDTCHADDGGPRRKLPVSVAGIEEIFEGVPPEEHWKLLIEYRENRAQAVAVQEVRMAPVRAAEQATRAAAANIAASTGSAGRPPSSPPPRRLAGSKKSPLPPGWHTPQRTIEKKHR